MILFLEKLNGLKILAADVTSEYLMADTMENIYIRLGLEFLEWAVKLAVVNKALNSLVGSHAQFYKNLCKELLKLGFKPSKADPDLYMRDAGDYYE